MNQIAQQLKEKNIAEYLIYMWQEEDLIRANHCEPEEMEANVIARYPEEQRPAMREWYTNLITMMGEEGVRERVICRLIKRDYQSDRVTQRIGLFS